MHIYALNMSAMYRQLCSKILLRGEQVVARNLTTLELTNVQLELANPRERFIGSKMRSMDMRYFIGELCYYLDGRTDLRSIEHYSKFWAKVSDDNKTVNSAYGHRMFKEKNIHQRTQFQWAMDVLTDDPYSRKAVVPIYSRDDARTSRDNPCTMFVQFLLRGKPLRLHMFVYMRSNDVWLGVPYDVAFFTVVQEIAFIYLRHSMPDIELGSYFHSAVSMHAYEHNLSELRRVAEEPLTNSVLAPALVKDDVVTWFDDLLTYEKSKRGVVKYKNESKRTDFQDWCKSFLD